jgi:hypothetical protein
VCDKNLGKKEELKIRRKNLGVWKKKKIFFYVKKRPVEFDWIKIFIKTNNSNDESTNQNKTLKIDDEYSL